MTETDQVRADQVTTPLFGFAYSQVVMTAVRLGVLEALKGAAKPVEAVASETSSHPELMRRLLRALIGLGFVERRHGDDVGLTPFGALFCADGPGAFHALALMYGDPATWQAWGSLETAVRTGQTAFDAAHGESLFEHLEHNVRLADRFHGAMREVTRSTVPGILQGHDFSRYRYLVDVGGGDGTLLAAVLEANAEAGGLVFDTALAVANASDVFARAGVSNRAQAQAGDFFRAVPKGGDAYLLRNILHDWDDDTCRTILRNCRDAMEPRAELLIFTLLMPEWDRSFGDPDTLTAAISDIEMMVLTSGRERTLGEYRQLLADTGLQVVDSTVLAGHPNHYVVRARPK
jgi:orsellinic acid C2-O-methyltransferase